MLSTFYSLCPCAQNLLFIKPKDLNKFRILGIQVFKNLKTQVKSPNFSSFKAYFTCVINLIQMNDIQI